MAEQPKADHDDKQPTSEAPPGRRVRIIETVQTPLGFFVLVVLVVEVILGVVTTMSAGSDRTYLIVGMLGLVFLLVLIVPAMAIFFPQALYGREPIPPGEGLPPSPLSRLWALHNTRWQVTIDQVEGPDGGPFKQSLRVNLRVKGDGVQGDFLDIDVGRGLRDPFVISGSLYFERFLQLDCRPKKPGVVQFSTWILEWHNRPTSLEGRFVGYGQCTGKIIYGTVSLTKVA